MLRWPGVTKAGRYDDLVSTIDIVPTILAAAGIDPPKEMPGLNLLDIAAGKAPLKRDAVFGEIFTHTAVDLKRPSLNLTNRWVRRGDLKLITFEAAGERKPPELYDLRRDPFEKENLSTKRPDDVADLLRRLDAWWDGRFP
jgi:uncharacterized sulfatase